MIQELLGGGFIGGAERKFSPSASPSTTNSTTTTPTTSTTSTTNAENQNLRCPRCDSANTKFCYYNNYNLTQPRHFCKTCRRYWTKGGALRNVPIGGGCRKNKTGGLVSPSSIGKSSPTTAGKVKTGFMPLIDHHEAITSNMNPVLWAGPQNSHLLALLRATQNPNPNPNPNSNLNPNSVCVKEEGAMVGTPMGLDNLNHASPIGLWRNNQYQAQAQQQHQHQQNGFQVGEVQQNTGFHELYQRLRLSSANYYTDHAPMVVNNVGSSTSTSSSTILESAPITGGDQLGFWNPTFSWSDLPATNGTAYP